MPWNKSLRTKVVICEEMKSNSSDFYQQFIAKIEQRNLEVLMEDVFVGNIRDFADTVRYGCLKAGTNCGFAIQELLKRNIPVILIGKDPDLTKVLGNINVAFPREQSDEMQEHDLHDLIFELSEVSEKLESLPPGVKSRLPTLGRKLRYDESTRRLFFTGTMTEKEKEQLLGLSEDEPYRKAIEALFLKEEIAGAIRWAEGFYPYLYDNIESKVRIETQRQLKEGEREKKRADDARAERKYKEFKGVVE